MAEDETDEGVSYNEPNKRGSIAIPSSLNAYILQLMP